MQETLSTSLTKFIGVESYWKWTHGLYSKLRFTKTKTKKQNMIVTGTKLFFYAKNRECRLEIKQGYILTYIYIKKIKCQNQDKYRK
jgi:hypothetical protein